MSFPQEKVQHTPGDHQNLAWAPREKLCPHTRRLAMQPSHWAPEPSGGLGQYLLKIKHSPCYGSMQTRYELHKASGAREGALHGFAVSIGQTLSPGPSANHGAGALPGGLSDSRAPLSCQ